MLDGAYDVQANTLRIFTVLSTLREEWAGALILSCGLSTEGADLALAANIAGGVCLSVDGSGERCRAALRWGAVDFAVNSLDEALRAIKNEIRQGRPLSVALDGRPGEVMAEVLERGVLPEVFVAFGGGASERDEAACRGAAAAFGELGSVLIDADGTLDGVGSVISIEGQWEAYVAGRGLSLERFAFETSAALRSFDRRVLDALPVEDSRHRWAAAAPRHFQRNRFAPASAARIYDRSLLLTRVEGELLRSEL